MLSHRTQITGRCRQPWPHADILRKNPYLVVVTLHIAPIRPSLVRAQPSCQLSVPRALLPFFNPISQTVPSRHKASDYWVKSPLRFHKRLCQLLRCSVSRRPTAFVLFTLATRQERARARATAIEKSQLFDAASLLLLLSPARFSAV